jgi:hypothetical protein
MLILGLLGMYFDAVLVFVTSQTLFLRLALAILWDQWQLKKSKSWEPFLSYQLNSTANPAHLPQNWAKLAKSAVLFSWYVAPKRLPGF